MAMTRISSQTASGDAALTFNSDIDSTYKLYIFKFININPVTNGTIFQFQVNATDSTGYDRTITSTAFFAEHSEGDSTGLSYYTSADQAQGTAYNPIAYSVGNGADESTNGTLWLFNPSNTTYAKHFYARVSTYHGSNLAEDEYVCGYINDTTAIDDIQFKMSSGNFDGTIKLYGVGG